MVGEGSKQIHRIKQEQKARSTTHQLNTRLRLSGTYLLEPFRGEGGYALVSAQLFKRAPEMPRFTPSRDCFASRILGERWFDSRFIERVPVVSTSSESGAPSSPPGVAPESPVPRDCACACYAPLGDGEGAGPPAVGPSFCRPISPRLP